MLSTDANKESLFFKSVVFFFHECGESRGGLGNPDVSEDCLNVWMKISVVIRTYLNCEKPPTPEFTAELSEILLVF